MYLGLVEDEDLYQNAEADDFDDSDEDEGEHRNLRAKGRKKNY